MPFIAVYDANVLYPNTLRDLLIRIAQLSHLVQAKWTEEILDEVTGNLRKNLPDITAEKADRLRRLMNAAVRDCLVSGYEPLIAALNLPDPATVMFWPPRSRRRPRLSSHRTCATFPQNTWLLGSSRRSPRTASYVTRSTSIDRPSGPVFSKLSTRVPGTP
jgi:hypothetical protein